jgi:hypothetical protein
MVRASGQFRADTAACASSMYAVTFCGGVPVVSAGADEIDAAVTPEIRMQSAVSIRIGMLFTIFIFFLC